MGRSPCCSKVGLNRGAWTAAEDQMLTDYIKLHGEGRWRNLPKRAGLMRCGKSCRLRWLNYLRPDIKRGNISHDEEELIIRLHKLLGNRWSLIAGRLPGRTDNEIKNYWNTNLSKKQQKVVHHGHKINTIASAHDKKYSNQYSDHHENNQSKSNMDPLQPKKEPSNVVRTKAVRCSKGFNISTPQPNTNTEPPILLAHHNTSSCMVKPWEKLAREEDNNLPDIGLAGQLADIGNVWLSEFLDSELMTMMRSCEFDASNIDTSRSGLSVPSSDGALMFYEDWSGNNFLQPISNDQGFLSFLEDGGDDHWLAD